MIQSKDRSKYFGGSDAHYVTGNWSTKTFKYWWLEKIGLFKSELDTKAMRVGNAYEHKILDAYSKAEGIEIEKDGQIVLEDIKLRVNYDGIGGDHIYEVKTYSSEEFKVSPNYQKQAQVEMFAYNETHTEKSKLSILAYPVRKEIEYLNYFEEVEPERIEEYPIEYDEGYIKEYLANLEVLCDCLERGVMPHEDERPNRNKPKSKKKSNGKG